MYHQHWPFLMPMEDSIFEKVAVEQEEGSAELERGKGQGPQGLVGPPRKANPRGFPYLSIVLRVCHL